MSWINSNATYKQNSKNDLSFYHGFSKTPVEPSTSNGNAATTLANASTKGGHTVIGTEVWAEEIPWFGLVPSRAVAVTRLSGLTKLNDLVKVDGEGGKVYKYIGADDATFTEAQWSSFWQEVTLTNGMTLNNRHNQPVLRYYLNQPMQTLTTTNNASIDSKGYATRLFVNETDHTGQTSGGSVVSQFAAGTDNIKNGIPSVELNPKLYLGTTEKIAGTHYYDYNVSGTILWSTAVTSSSPKISCFRYIGKTVTGQLATVESALSAHTADISDIKLALGLEDTNPDGTQSVTARVETVEDVVRVLLGLGSDATITATESIATTAANVVSTSLSGTTEGTIGKAIADAKQEALNAINAIQHFSVVVVPQGQTMENVTPVENTIYLVSDTNAADGSYIEYIAFKQGETVVTEKIGSTKIDLSGYATVTTVNGIDTRLQTAEGQIATITSTDATKEGSIAKALADAKTYAEGQAATAKSGAETTAANALSAARTEITAEIAQAKSEAIASAEVTITAGTGIVVTGEGKGTTFEISVSDDVATAASVSALSQVVASNKTELEGKITAASTALETAKTEIKGTTDALDSRLTDAESGIEALTTGDNSVDKQIETAANAIKGQSLAQTGTLSGMFSVQTAGTVGTGITGITISDAGLAQAISDAKSGAEQTAATNLATARGEITTEISDAVSGLKTELTTGEGSLGAKVAALETATGTTLPAAIEQALTDAKAYSDSLHTTSLDYVVLGDSESLPTASADTLGKIYLVASQNAPAADGAAISGAYVEYMTRKVGEGETATYTWEKIGTTAADLSGYAKSVKINGTTYTASAANAGALDLGTVVTDTYNSMASGTNSAAGQPNADSVYVGINNGGIGIGIASATDSVMGVSKMFTGNLTTAASTATDTAVSVKSAQAMYSSLATLANGKVASVTAGEGDALTGLSVSVGGSVTAPTISVMNGVINSGSLPATAKVVANGLIDGTDVIETEKINFGEGLTNDGVGFIMKATQLTTWVGDMPNLQSGYNMFSASAEIETFCGDLSSMTIGSSMFYNCAKLTSFTSDLSSLTNGSSMFYNCKLDAESLECIAETLPKVTSGTIDIGASTNATDEVIATIKGKGWAVESNGSAL